MDVVGVGSRSDRARFVGIGEARFKLSLVKLFTPLPNSLLCEMATCFFFLG